MNPKQNLIFLASLSGAAIGITSIEALIIFAKERKKREEIDRNSELDSIAIRRAKDAMIPELESGKYDHLSLDEVLRMVNQRIEFERIAIRLED